MWVLRPHDSKEFLPGACQSTWVSHTVSVSPGPEFVAQGGGEQACRGTGGLLSAWQNVLVVLKCLFS